MHAYALQNVSNCYSPILAIVKYNRQQYQTKDTCATLSGTNPFFVVSAKAVIPEQRRTGIGARAVTLLETPTAGDWACTPDRPAGPSTVH